MVIEKLFNGLAQVQPVDALIGEKLRKLLHAVKGDTKLFPLIHLRTILPLDLGVSEGVSLAAEV